MRRKFLIAANWKMHPAPQSSQDISSPYHPRAGIDVVVFPTFLDLRSCIDAELTVGAQYGRPEPEGAFTGDVSMKMLKDIGCRYVLCGHSERRQFHHETAAFVAEQSVAALEAGLHPIVCIGETEQERKKGKAKEVVEGQLKGIPHGEITIAYEPVWAIGTGVNASPKDAQEMHLFIRSLLPKAAQDSTRILYGGSVTELNAKDLLTEPDIDGFLIGGASLKPEVFGEIVETAVTL